MKFGVREICDVVLRAKAAQKIGNKVFYKNEPVLYFDSLKTSTLEGAATTVYAQGGRGNARLIAWEGERTVTFTMEDALISPMGFSVLTGAGLAAEKPIYLHQTEQTTVLSNDGTYAEIALSKKPYCTNEEAANEYEKTTDIVPKKGTDYYTRSGSEGSYSYTKASVTTVFAEDTDYYVKKRYNKPSDTEDFIYVMLLDDNGEIISEPYIASESRDDMVESNGKYIIKVYGTESDDSTSGSTTTYGHRSDDNHKRVNDISKLKKDSVVLVDYYIKKDSGAFQIDITPDKFGGNFYLEASTLFRATNGVDMPAEFIIPNCKIQSNFTFTMASSGDPSTFTFTMDAFPDYTRWDRTKKVFAAIQVIEDSDTLTDFERLGTPHNYEGTDYGTTQKDHIEKV